MGRQDRRLPLRRRGPRELYVGDGVRKQSHARFSLRDYSAVRVCHSPMLSTASASATKKSPSESKQVADELVRFTKALRN